MKANEVLIYIKDKIDLAGLATLQARLGKLRTNIRAAFNSAPVRAFRNAVLAVGAAFVAAVVEGAKFNVQMARVWTVTGGGIDNFKELRKEARGLAADFGKARSEIANGMYNALSAGIDQSNLESFMRSAAQVAVADGSDISTAVDGITTVLNAFGIEATRTEEVTDLLFQTVKLGKTTFGELSRSLSNVASTAAASGVPLEQVLAHIAALTAQGTPTAQATTQIRQSIIGLNKALGDGWSNSMGYQEGLRRVWQQSNKSPTKLLELVGSTEAMAAVLGGVGEKAVLAADKLAGMSDAAGAAKEAFDKVDQFRHWPKALESARGFLSKFGEEINERVAPFVDAVTEKIKEWTKSESLWEKIRDVMDAAADRLQAAGAAVREIVSQINSMADLKVFAETIGDWLKDKLKEGGKEASLYLAEKAVSIGTIIGTAAWDFLAEHAKKLDFLKFGDFTEWLGSVTGYYDSESNKKDPIWKANAHYKEQMQGKQPPLTAQQKVQELFVEFSPEAEQTLSEMFAANLEKRDKAIIQEAALEYEADKTAAISEVINMAASGMSTEEIDGIIQSWELTQDEIGILMDALDSTAETANEAAESAESTAKAAGEMQQATAESLDATTQSHDALKVAMESTTTAAQETQKVAQQSVDALDVVADQNAQMVDMMRQITSRLDGVEFEIQNLKV